MEPEIRLGSRRPAPSQMRSKSWSGSLVQALNWNVEDVFGSQVRQAPSHREEDEEALKWAALEKLPTYARLRTGIIKSLTDDETLKEVDVRKLDVKDRQQFIDRLFRVAEEDNQKFLQKFRKRIDK